MRNGVICSLALAVSATAAFGADGVKPKATVARFTTAVPTKAPQPDRWTTLLCHFDKAGTYDADVAVGIREASGCFDACKSGQPGRFGKAAFVGPDWGLLFYHGQANVNFPAGTADFWIKSAKGRNIWKDGGNHYLLGLHAGGWFVPELILRKTARNTIELLYLKDYRRPHPELRRIELPCAKLAADKWHHVMASWDLPNARLSLTVNGKGSQAGVTPPPKTALGDVRALYVGGRRYAYHLRETAGAYMDELRVRSRSAGWLKQHPPRSIQKETGWDDRNVADLTRLARRWLLSRARWQRFGGWGGCGWPMRSRKGAYWWRDYVPTGSVVAWGKAHGGTAHYGALFLLGYEALQEQWMYDVAAKTGEMLLLTQSPEGWWRGCNLSVTPAGLKYNLPPVPPDRAPCPRRRPARSPGTWREPLPRRRLRSPPSRRASSSGPRPSS